MPKRSRQQRRASSRRPSHRRAGSRIFLALMMVILVGGVGLAYVFRANPPPLTRGASAGEHWHASYKVYICGKRMNNYPTVEGELHSHGDGFMHIHPRTPTFTGDNANVRNFFLLYETSIVEDANGKRTLTFPDGTTYKDGDRCPKSKKRYDIVATNKGKPIEGDPGAFIPHDGDVVEIRFGKKGEKPMPNPYAKAKGLPDPGASGRATPAPDSGEAPAPAPAPETGDDAETDADASPAAEPEESP